MIYLPVGKVSKKHCGAITWQIVSYYTGIPIEDTDGIIDVTIYENNSIYNNRVTVVAD